MYKSVIDLVPPQLDVADYLRVAGRTFERYGSIAFSLDDAFKMMEGGADGSHLRVWHYNYFSPIDQKRLVDSGFDLKFFALDNRKPYVWDIALDLPTGGDGYSMRDVQKITALTVHHSVGWSDESSNFQNAMNIASFHVNSKGWPGIGYHFLIPPNGEIMQVNAIDLKSFHAGSYSAPGDENEWSVGICFGGDFRFGATPTDSQISCGRALIASLRRDLPNHLSVIPHKRMPGASTVCPGDAPDGWLKVLNYG